MIMSRISAFVGCLYFLGPVFFPDATNALADSNWTVLENCEFVPNPSNDGDSFHVRADGKEYVFRLYFVDAAEIEASDPARLIEQAKHYGVEVPEVIQIGEDAKRFVEKQLAKPFVVTTRMANGLGRGRMERFYAFVRTKDGDLGELLVANGLARIQGRSIKTPEGVVATAEKRRLEELESQAIKKRLGGWSAKIARSTPQSAPSASPTSDNRVAQPHKEGKIDINTATEKELETIPDIGPKITQRIIEARPFDSADDLKRVSGIGNKKYEKIRPYFK